MSEKEEVKVEVKEVTLEVAEETKIKKANKLATEEKKPSRFTKEKLLKAKAFEGQSDIICCVVADGELVTTDEVEKRILEFLKKEVK